MNSVHIFRTEYRLQILDKLEKIIFLSSTKPWREFHETLIDKCISFKK